MMRLLCRIAAMALFLPWGSAMAQDFVVFPAQPTSLDTVRLRWTHVGCTNPDSVQVVMQQANRITVEADRILFPDCGTVQGYFEEFTLGRLPSGEYDAQLIVNPPPGTLGPVQLVGSVHVSVARLPPTSSPSPHDDYSDLWWNPRRSGEAFLVKQSGANLFAVWVVYDSAGRAAWFSLQPAGGWARDTNNVLRYKATVYRTTGPWWGSPYDPARLSFERAGDADFIPASSGRASIEGTIDGVALSIPLERMRF